jgi:hypothetical protein
MSAGQVVQIWERFCLVRVVDLASAHRRQCTQKYTHNNTRSICTFRQLQPNQNKNRTSPASSDLLFILPHDEKQRTMNAMLVRFSNGDAGGNE